MKRIVVGLLGVLLLISVCGCSSFNQVSKKPDSNLEFWITENVESIDFSEYTEKLGLMGGRMYYGKGYSPSTEEMPFNNVEPNCVVYTVTKYPDYSSKNSHITRIEITDPTIHFYGLTLNSSEDEIDRVMKEQGYTALENKGYQNGRITIVFSEESIIINAEVTNRRNLLF